MKRKGKPHHFRIILLIHTIKSLMQLVVIVWIFHEWTKKNIEMMKVCHRRGDEQKWRERQQKINTRTLEERTKQTHKPFIIFIRYLNETHTENEREREMETQREKEHSPSMSFGCLCYLWCVTPHSKQWSGGRALTRQFEPFELNFATVLSILEMHFDCMCGCIESAVHHAVATTHTHDREEQIADEQISKQATVCSRVHPLIRLSRTLCM